MNFMIKLCLGNKDGAWVQVDHELEFTKGNLEQIKKILKMKSRQKDRNCRKMNL